MIRVRVAVVRNTRTAAEEMREESAVETHYSV